MKTSLKFKRMERGLKQADLADLVNVRRETIGRLEQGQYCPSLRLAMDLAKALDTTVEDCSVLTTKSDASACCVCKFLSKWRFSNEKSPFFIFGGMCERRHMV